MKKSTGELLELLKKSSTVSSYINQAAPNLIQQVPLHNYLSNLLTEKGQKKSDVIHRSGLDRGYAYEIFSGNKIPSRDKLLALCFAIPLSTEEVQRLLNHTGYPQLYARIERDSILLFALEHRLSLSDTNELLYEMHYECLS